MRVATRLSGAAVAVLGALLLAACVDGTGRDATYGLVVLPDLHNLDGDTLVANHVIDPGHTLVSGTRITMAFTSDAVTVNAGCNALHGPASVDDYELVIGNLAATSKACDQARTEQDRWLSRFLVSRPSFERVDEDLYLARKDTVIHLVPEDD